MRFKAQDDGFTLIELLISLALLSLMAIYAIQAFNTLRSMNRIEAEVAAQMEVDAVARLLHSELGDARAVFQQDKSQTPKLYFTGKSDSLSFVVASNGERETGGLYYVTLSLDSKSTLTSKRQLIGVSLNEHINEITLLRSVDVISFTYVNTARGPETLKEWSATNQLPKAVGVNISFPKTDKRHAIDLMVRLETVE
jgi:general secretion pathway protein J